MAEQWTYLGRRPGTKVKTVDVWRDEQGQRLAFKAARPRPIVGGLYSANYDRGAATLSGSPEWTGRMADDATDVRLTADSFDQDLARARAESQARKRTELDGALREVKALAAGLSWESREALIRHLARVVHSA